MAKRKSSKSSKRKHVKTRLRKGPGASLAPKDFKTIQKLISTGRFSDGEIVRIMSRKHVIVSNSLVNVIRKEMKRPKVKGVGANIPTKTVTRAKQLVSTRQFNDSQIVTELKKEGIFANRVTVGKIRKGMGEPRVIGIGSKQPPKHIEKARQIIAKNPDMKPRQISALLKKLGFPVSITTVYRLKQASIGEKHLPEPAPIDRARRIESWTTVFKIQQTPKGRIESLEKLQKALSDLNQTLSKIRGIEERTSLIEKRQRMEDMIRALQSLVEKD